MMLDNQRCGGEAEPFSKLKKSAVASLSAKSPDNMETSLFVITLSAARKK